VKKLAVAAFACMFAACALALAGEVMTTDGLVEGRLKEVTGGEGGVVKYDDTEVPLSKVVRLDFGGEKAKQGGGFLVVMTNGDRIVGKLTGGDEKGLIVKSRTLGKRKMSIKNLLAVFNLEKSSDTTFIEEKIALDNAEDTVFLTGGQRTGGVLEKIDDNEVSLTDVPGLGSVKLKYDTVLAVKLAPLSKPEAPKGLHATVYMNDGGQITGELVKYADGKLSLKWYGVPVDLSKSEILSVYLSGGKTVYLSDLKPASVQETPFFDNFLYHYQLDHSLVKKDTISIKGDKFFKGVSVHSKTELTYTLDKKYAMFESVIGMDDEAKGKGDVVFSVLGDGKELFNSGNVTGKSDKKLVKVDVSEVRELKLVVDFGKDLDTMDRAVWADAVLVVK
jgi:hypothetical protein